jgi:hypothetical protein
MKKGYNTLLVWAVLLVLLLPAGCGFKENTEGCPQGIELTFYSKTPCQPQRSYPTEISDLRTYVFDESGVLSSLGHAPEARISEDYVQSIEARNGLYTVVAWSGVDGETFDMAAPVVGVTTKEDVLFSLRNAGGRAASYNNHRVFYGESEAVYLPDPALYGSVFKEVAVNMEEITNRITVEVEGLPDPDDYEVAIESGVGAVSLGGEQISGPEMEYLPVVHPASDELVASFTMMNLTTGFDTMLVVRHKETGQELYRGDLLGTLLLKNPSVNLACDHDFTIRFTTADSCGCGTYTVMEIWVNRWLVHSYETDL